MAASTASRWSAGSLPAASMTAPRPLLGSAPTAASASPCWANMSAKYTFTA